MEDLFPHKLEYPKLNFRFSLSPCPVLSWMLLSGGDEGSFMEIMVPAQNNKYTQCLERCLHVVSPV
jgi:hypothetical protein